MFCLYVHDGLVQQGYFAGFHHGLDRFKLTPDQKHAVRFQTMTAARAELHALGLEDDTRALPGRRTGVRCPHGVVVNIGAPNSVARYVSDRLAADPDAFGENRWAVFEYTPAPTLRAAQPTRALAERYMRDGRVLIDLDSYRRTVAS